MNDCDKLAPKRYLGIDIGGTEVKIGTVSENGSVAETASYSVNFDGYRTPVLQTVLESCRRFLENFQRKASDYALIGVSTTGTVSENGVIAGAAEHIPGWTGSRVKEALEREFGIPACVINDANAAVLGEVWTGAARGKRNVIAVTIGTGVGGGVLADGRLLLGARGYAGELGHIPIQYRGVGCTCGARGCLEQYGSTTALVRTVRELFPEVNPEAINGRWIFARAQTEDAAVLAALDGWMDAIAAGVVGLIHIFNPEAVLIGGGVSAQQKLFIEPLKRKILGQVIEGFEAGLEIRAAALHNEAGMVGAVAYAIQCSNNKAELRG